MGISSPWETGSQSLFPMAIGSSGCGHWWFLLLFGKWGTEGARPESLRSRKVYVLYWSGGKGLSLCLSPGFVLLRREFSQAVFEWYMVSCPGVQDLKRPKGPILWMLLPIRILPWGMSCSGLFYRKYLKYSGPRMPRPLHPTCFISYMLIYLWVTVFHFSFLPLNLEK